MNEADYQAWLAVQEKMFAQIEALAAEMGPRNCPHADSWAACDDDECGYTNTSPSASLLTGFALITTWMKVGDDTSRDVGHIQTIVGPRQQRTHTIGMMQIALDEGML